MPEDLAWFGSRLHHHIDPYLAIEDQQVEALYRHFDLLLRWNRKINLTSIRSPEEMVLRHYCESLYFASHMPSDWVDFADIGSGGGFPGIPMAVYRPDWNITLVEAHQRKAVFLREATRKLPNLCVFGDRADKIKHSFGAIVSRAVDPADILALAPHLGTNVGLLAGDKDFDHHVDIIAKIRLPWADSRFAVYACVQRET